MGRPCTPSRRDGPCGPRRLGLLIALIEWQVAAKDEEDGVGLHHPAGLAGLEVLLVPETLLV